MARCAPLAKPRVAATKQLGGSALGVAELEDEMARVVRTQIMPDLQKAAEKGAKPS